MLVIRYAWVSRLLHVTRSRESRLAGADIRYLDTGGLQLVIDGETVEPGNQVYGLYCLLE